MNGYILQFERGYDPSMTKQTHTIMPIGQISSQHVVDSTNNEASIDSVPRCNVRTAAARVDPPRMSQNFMAPVNDVSLFCSRLIGAVSNN